MAKRFQVIRQNVGCDIAKADFKACIRQTLSNQVDRIKASRTFKNTLTGFKAFIKWVNKHCSQDISIKVTLEPTGVYHENFIYYCHEETDYELSLVLANRSRAYAKSLGIETKTDKVDASTLAMMGLERKLKIWQPISPKFRLIKQLCRERVSMLRHKTALSNRLSALNSAFQVNKNEIKRINKQIRLIKQQIKEVEKDLKNAIKADPSLKEKIDNICKLPGFNIISVSTLVAETNGFELFTNKGQVIKYAGYDVVQRESGSSIKGKNRISKKGNYYIRRVLHFPALTTVKFEGPLKKLFDRVLLKSGIKMKAYVAVQRKMLVLAYTLFKKNEAYDPQYQANKEKAVAC